MMRKMIAVAMLCAGFALVAAAKDSASAPPAATRPVAPLIGAMRVATLPAVKLLCLDLDTTFADLPKVAGPAIDRLIAAAGSTRFEGSLLFRYPPMNDMTSKFTMQIGFPVNADTVAPAGTRLIDLPAFKCATLLYTGPMAHLHDGFDAIFKAIGDADLKPAGESREAYFYFESQESDNNVTQIQVAVE